MIRGLLIVLFCTLLAWGGDNDLKLHARMIDKLSTDLVKKSNPKIYDPIFGKTYDHFLSSSKPVTTCNEADIAIVALSEQLPEGCNPPIVLVTKYRLLTTVPEAVGALYWQKGRLNLVFIRPRLMEKKVHLNAEYANLTDDRIY